MQVFIKYLIVFFLTLNLAYVGYGQDKKALFNQLSHFFAKDSLYDPILYDGFSNGVSAKLIFHYRVVHDTLQVTRMRCEQRATAKGISKDTVSHRFLLYLGNIASITPDPNDPKDFYLNLLYGKVYQQIYLNAAHPRAMDASERKLFIRLKLGNAERAQFIGDVKKLAALNGGH